MKAYIVERDRLRNNIDAVKRKADGRAVYAVLKGNGYGLGMLQFAHELRDCGIERFAVTEPTDAIKLRLAGFIDEEILVMRSTADERDIADILEAKAVATIGSYESAVVLNGMAEKRGEVVEAHIKIDTGMGRYGFRESETDKVLSIFSFYAEDRDLRHLFTQQHGLFWWPYGRRPAQNAARRRGSDPRGRVRPRHHPLCKLRVPLWPRRERDGRGAHRLSVSGPRGGTRRLRAAACRSRDGDRDGGALAGRGQHRRVRRGVSRKGADAHRRGAVRVQRRLQPLAGTTSSASAIN